MNELSKTVDPEKKWANIILSGENEAVLEGTKWQFTYTSKIEDKVFGIMYTYEFKAEGKLVRNGIAPHTSSEYPFETTIETTTYIDTWSREGDTVKAIFANGATLFEGKYDSQNKKIIGTSYYSSGKSKEEIWVLYKDGDIEKFKELLNGNKQNEQRTAYNDVQNNSSFNLTPPSKLLIFLGIGLLIGGFVYLFINLNNEIYSPNITKLIISGIIMLCSIPFFSKYGRDKNIYHYNCVCYEMSQWVGSSSNDLIIKWGAPTKTYKFPTDKTMTVLEYKDSIRNYAGVRYKGMYAGQAKTTKYIKSFFVKDGVIINYKYAIS